MNNIPDNPARTASPESPVEPNFKWESRALVNNYLSNPSPIRPLTKTEAMFEEALENHLVETGMAHAFMRMAFSANRFDLDVEVIDFVNDFALAFVKSEAGL